MLEDSVKLGRVGGNIHDYFSNLWFCFGCSLAWQINEVRF